MLIDHVSNGLDEIGADDLAIDGGVEVAVAAGGFAGDVLRVTRLEYRLVAGQEAVGLLELAVEDAALEGEGELGQARHTDLSAGHEVQTERSGLVFVAPGVGTEVADEARGVIHAGRGEVDGELGVALEQAVGEATRADVGDEEGAVPLDAEHAPRDGHRVHAAVG